MSAPCNVSEDLAEGIAKELEQEKKEAMASKYMWDIHLEFPEEPKYVRTSVGEIAQKLAKEMLSLSGKTGKTSLFTIAGSSNPRKRCVSFPYTRQNSLSIIGNAEVVTLKEAVEIAEAIDGIVDVILVDGEQKKAEFVGMMDEIRKVVKRSRILSYRDGDSLVNAADSFICQLLRQTKETKISILGDNDLGCKLALKLADQGLKVTLWGKKARRLQKVVEGLNFIVSKESLGEIRMNIDLLEASKGADVLIGIIPHFPLITSQMLKLMKNRGIIIDAGVGTLYPKAIEYGIAQGFHLYRLDMRAGLSGEITNVLETSQLISKVVGSEEYSGVRVVAGGMLGRKGDVVIDSIHRPSRIIGVADGRGGLLDESQKQKYQRKLSKVKAEMIKRKFLP